MEPEGRYTIIGTLVLLLAAVTVFALVWLGGYSRVEQHFYTIYFERQSLRGIQVGGDVNIRGLKVGQIVSYAISPANVNRVKVNIRVDGQSPVSTGTTAVISRNLVTSVARVDLETPDPQGPILTKVLPNESYPIIPEGASEFDALSDAVNQITLNGASALRNLSEFLSEDNREAFSESVAGLRNLMTGLSNRLDALDVAARDLSRTADTIQQSGERITTAFEDTARSFNQAMRPLAQDTGAAMRDLRALFSDTRSAITALGATMERLERSTASTLDRAGQATDVGLLEFRATARELRIVVDGLGRTLDKLTDPRATLLGPGTSQLGPGER